MPLITLSVFVSSTWLDLQQERAAVLAATQRLHGVHFVGMEFFGSRDEPPDRLSVDEVDDSDLYIAIVGGRYGSGITELEYMRARERGVPCFVYLKRGRGEVSPHETDEGRRKLGEFRASLVRQHTCSEFDSPEELAAKLTADLYNWQFERQLARGLSPLSTDYLSRVQAFVGEYVGSNERNVPFGGRTRELEQLTRWMADANAPRFMLIAAGAGKGKSALLVRWVRQILNEGNVAAVFFPISIRFRTNLASVTFASLASYLATLHGEALAVSPDTPAEVWRSLMTDFLTRPLKDGRSLLVVLDGLDEAADWDAGPDLFPRHFNRNVRVVVAARLLAGDVDASDWLRRLGWDHQKTASTLSLSSLEESGVAEALDTMGFPLAGLGDRTDIVSELHRLTEGEPLLVRLYVDDLWNRGEGAARLQVQDLRTIEPGLDGYFARWWDDQRRLWGASRPLQQARVQTILNLLACALGPLTRDDLLSLTSPMVELNTWTLDEALEPLRRFVVGDGVRAGYVFSHPRLGVHFYERLTRAERDNFDREILTWCSEHVAVIEHGRCPPGHASPYVVQYFGAHLDRAKALLPQFTPLLSDAWRRAWQAHDGTYSGYQGDLRRIQTAARTRPADGAPDVRSQPLAMEVRAGLCLASVGEISKNTPPELVTALVERGLWSRTSAVAYARLVQQPERRARALIYLGTHLDEPAKTLIFKDVLAAVSTVDDARKVPLLTGAAQSLPATLVATALDLALSISHKGVMRDAVMSLAHRLSPRQTERVRIAACGIKDVDVRLALLRGLAAQQPGPLLAFALDEPDIDSWERAWILVGCSDGLAGDERHTALARALAVARQMERGGARFDLELSIAERLDSAKRSIELQRIVEQIRTVDNALIQATVFSRTATLVPDSMREEMIDSALAAASRIQSPALHARAIASLAPRLGPVRAIAALDSVARIADEEAKAHAIAALLPHLPAETHDRALKPLLDIEDPFERLWAVAPIADYLPDAALFDLVSCLPEGISAPEWHFSVVTALAQRAPRAVVEAIDQGSWYELQRLAHCAAIAPYVSGALRARTDVWMLTALGSVGNYFLLEATQEILRFTTAWAESATEDALAKAVDIILRWQTPEPRFAVIDALSPRLPGPLLQHVLLNLQEIGDSEVRLRLQAACLERLPTDTVRTTFGGVWSRLRVADRVADMLRRLSETPASTELRTELIDALPQLEALPHFDRGATTASAIAAFIRHIGTMIRSDEVTRLIEVGLALENAQARANSLARLAPHLDETHLTRHFATLFGAALDDSDEAVALAASIASRTPEHVFVETFDVFATSVCKVPTDLDMWGRPLPGLLALIRVVDRLSGSRRTFAAERLLAALSATSDSRKALLLVTIGWYLTVEDSSWFERCLDIARGVRHPVARTQAVLGLISRLREPTLTEAATNLVEWIEQFPPDVRIEELQRSFRGLPRAAADAGLWRAALVLEYSPKLSQDIASHWIRGVLEELAASVPSPLTIEICLALLPKSHPQQREELAGAALKVVPQFGTAFAQLDALASLFPWLPPADVSTALEATIRSIGMLVGASNAGWPVDDVSSLFDKLRTNIPPRLTKRDAAQFWRITARTLRASSQLLVTFLERAPVKFLVADGAPLRATAGLSTPSAQGQGLRVWAARMPADGALKRLAQIASATDPAFMALAYSHLVSRTPVEGKEQCKTMAMDYLKRTGRTSVDLHQAMLSATVDEEWHELELSALETLQSLRVDDQAPGCGLVLPFLHEPLRSTTAALAIQSLAGVENESARLSQLARLSPILPGSVMQDAVRIVSAAEDRTAAFTAALDLVRFVDAQHCQHLVNVIVGNGRWIEDDRAFDAVVTRTLDLDVAAVLTTTLTTSRSSHLSTEAFGRLLQLWGTLPKDSQERRLLRSDLISLASSGSRRDVMEMLRQMLPHLDQEATSASIAHLVESLDEVSRWWP